MRRSTTCRLIGSLTSNIAKPSVWHPNYLEVELECLCLRSKSIRTTSSTLSYGLSPILLPSIGNLHSERLAYASSSEREAFGLDDGAVARFVQANDAGMSN